MYSIFNDDVRHENSHQDALGPSAPSLVYCGMCISVADEQSLFGNGHNVLSSEIDNLSVIDALPH